MKNIIIGFLTAIIAAAGIYFFMLAPEVAETPQVDDAPQTEVLPEETPQETPPVETPQETPQEDLPQIEGTTIITYDVNGGDALENRFDKVNYGDNVTMIYPTRMGYTFLGWELDGEIIENGIWSIVGNVELVASWEADVYTITYNNIDNATNSNQTSYIIDNQTITLVDAVKSGYTFLGWYSNSYFTSSVTTIDSNNLENVELYAKWSINNYTLTYNNVNGAVNSNVASYTVEDGIITLNDLSKAGYTFLGWYGDNGLVTTIDPTSTTNLELEARWSINSYTLSYSNLNDVENTNPTSYTVEDGTITLANLSKDGYTFVGWYSNNSIVRTINTSNLLNLELEARWTIVEYTITYNEALGYVTNNNPEFFTTEDTIVLEDATREDYIFLGWYSDDSLTNKVTELTTLENVVLYASWEYDWVLSAHQEALVTHYQAIIDSTNSAAGNSSSSFFALNAADSGYVDGETSLKFANFLDISGVTSTSYMFYNSTKLEIFDAMNYDTSNATTLAHMFSGCSSLIYLDASRFDTSNSTSLAAMFNECSSLTSLDVSRFDTSNVTTFSYMFTNCSALTLLDVSGFDTSNAAIFSYMFKNCSSLTTLNVSGFDTSNATAFSSTFSGCSALTSLDVSGFSTSKVTSFSYMFNECSSLTTLNVSGFNTSSATTFAAMFSYCSKLTVIDVSGFNTSKVTSLNTMFRSCSKITSLNTSGWNTSNVASIQYTFADCVSLSYISGISNWNVSKLTTTTSTMMAFYNTDKLTRPSWY